MLEIINYGVEPGDQHDGDTLRAAMIKCVNNFNYLLSLFDNVPTNSGLTTAINNLQIQINAIETDLSNYAPLNHTHTISQIIGLQNALDNLTPLTTFNAAITNINLLISQINEQIADLLLELHKNTEDIQTIFGILSGLTQTVDTTSKYIISGGATWSGVGLTYNTSTIVYNYYGVVGSVAPSTIMISSGSPSPRFDVIAVTSAGELVVIEGVSSPNPIIPAVGEDQIMVQAILIDTNATVPTVTQENVYLNNDGWNRSTYTVGTPATGTVEFNYTGSTQEGEFAIRANVNKNLGIRFQKATGNLNLAQYTTLSFWFKLDASLPIGAKLLSSVWLNGSTVGTTVNLSSFGVSSTDTSGWYLVTVPTSAWGAGLIDRIQFRMDAFNGQTEFFLDTIKFSTGPSVSYPTDTIQIQNNGAIVGERSKLNFIPGNNIALSLLEDAANDRINITITSTASGSTGTTAPIIFTNFAGTGATNTTDNIQRSGSIRIRNNSSRYISTQNEAGNVGSWVGHNGSGEAYMDLSGISQNGGLGNIITSAGQHGVETAPALTFSGLRNIAYNASSQFTGATQMMFKFVNGYGSLEGTSRESLVDIRRDAVRFWKYPTSRNDGGTSFNYLSTDSNGNILSKPVIGMTNLNNVMMVSNETSRPMVVNEDDGFGSIYKGTYNGYEMKFEASLDPSSRIIVRADYDGTERIITWPIQSGQLTTTADLDDRLDQFRATRKVGSLTITPDGSTTTFTFPHGLDGVPEVIASRKQDPSTNLFETYADGTNIIVNFPSTPMVGGDIVISYIAEIPTP